MAGFEIRPYNPDDINPANANWKIDGVNGNWQTLEDPNYGIYRHVAVVKDGIARYDKVDQQLGPGVYVLPVRINPERKAEFLIPSELRVILPDENGVQGGVWIRNIPQGKIEEGEMPHQAALRELEAETGYKNAQLVGLEKLYLPANSSYPLYYYMGIVPYKEQPQKQQLDEHEVIMQNSWMTLPQLRRIRIQDLITRGALDLAVQWLRPQLL